MSINVQIRGQSARIVISGRFEFDVHREFKNAYTPLLDNVAMRGIEIDMGKVDYLDSAALGMLLLLKDRAEKTGKQIALINSSRVALQVLEISNFSKLFNVKNVP